MVRFARMALPAVTLLVCSLIWGASGRGELSSDNPHGVLPVGADGRASAWAEAAEKLDAEIRETRRLIDEKAAAGPIAAVSPTLIGNGIAQATQLDRLGARLEQVAEPAGYELRLRAGAYRAAFDEWARQRRNAPEVAEELARELPKVDGVVRRQAGLYRRALNAAQREKYQEAEDAIDKIYAAALPRTLWYDDKTNARWYATLWKLETTVRDQAARQRRTETALRIKSALTKDRERFDELRQRNAADQVEASEGALSETAVAAAVARLQRLQVIALKAQGQVWRLRSLNESVETEAAPLLVQVERERAQLVAHVTREIGRRANAATSANAAGTRAEALRLLAPLFREDLLSEDEVLAAQVALEGFAEKSSALAARLSRYRRATQPRFHWLRLWNARAGGGDGVRFAEAWANAMHTPALASQPVMSLPGPLPPQAANAWADLKDKMVVVEAAWGSLRWPQLAEEPLTIAEAPPRLAAAVLAPATPPLSIAALAEVESCQGGRFKSAAAALVGFRLEPLTTALVAWPEDRPPLTKPGQAMSLPNAIPPHQAVLVRPRLQWRWARGGAWRWEAAADVAPSSTAR